MAKNPDFVEVEASFEQNYRVNPDDPYVMARACMHLRAVVPLKEDGVASIEHAYERLQKRCQDNVIAFIEAEQAKTKTSRDDL